jgi:hypothetical protein
MPAVCACHAPLNSLRPFAPLAVLHAVLLAVRAADTASLKLPGSLAPQPTNAVPSWPKTLMLNAASRPS